MTDHLSNATDRTDRADRTDRRDVRDHTDRSDGTGPTGRTLADHPRLDLAGGPTPLRRMDRLARLLGKPEGSLLVKRDDLTHLAAGGNKVRKLEFVVAAALAEGADCLVTGGGVQSNSARATSAAAAMHGLGCRLVLDGAPPSVVSGNLTLDHLFGAEVTFRDRDDTGDLDLSIAAEAERVAAQGRRPYVVPVGASSPLGSLGYVMAADEILREVPDVELIVVATGSAGTQAGLAAGVGDHDRILGVRVGERRELPARVEALAAQTAALAGRATPTGSCVLDDDQLGAGYAIATPACYEAIMIAGRTEGLVLDPVYSGKSMAALIDRCRRGVIAPETKVVFVHTGGMPGLLAAEKAAEAASAATTAAARGH